MAEDIRHMAVYRELYRLRKEKIERVFADAKEKHGMRYTQYRGLAQVTNWVKLKFAAMNLKKLATWKWNCRHPAPDGGKRTRLGKKIQLLFRYFSFLRSCLHAKNLLWLNCHSRFFDKLRARHPCLALTSFSELFGTYTASHKSKAQPIALTRSSGLLYLTFA